MSETEDSDPKRKRRVTAQDVADAAGVSRSAVSRAFTKGAYLDAEKRALIEKTARELGYRPNALAAGLQGAKSNLVAVFVGDLRNQYDMAAVSQLVSALNKFGKWPIVIDGGDVATGAALSKVLSFPLDAMILRSGSIDPEIVDQCGKLNIPMISSGRILDGPRVDNVCVKNSQGGQMAAELLLAQGRRRFAYIGGPANLTSAMDRRAGVLSVLSQGGAKLLGEAEGGYTIDGGYAAAQSLLQSLDVSVLDAVICANDAMALGCLSALREADISVPEQIAIVGFDDIEMAQWRAFDLTTVRNPIPRMVQAVIELLERRLADPNKRSETILIEPELILRATHSSSTGAP